jgi:hypothetical protein
MYLMHKHDGDDAVRVAQQTRPFGPGFPEELVKRAHRLEVWGSQFTDPGPDKTVFKLYDIDGAVIGEREVAGY